MAKTLFGGGAFLTGAFLLTALTFNSHPSVAGNLAGNSNQKTQGQQKSPEGQGLLGEITAPTLLPETSDSPEPAESVGAAGTDSAGSILSSARNNGVISVPAEKYTATAYALRGRTASGAHVRRGLIAADRRVLPLGSRVRLEAGGYSGEYLVADTGGAIRGRKIDIWMPSAREALRFGRRAVKLTVLSLGGRRALKKRT